PPPCTIGQPRRTRKVQPTGFVSLRGALMYRSRLHSLPAALIACLGLMVLLPATTRLEAAEGRAADPLVAQLESIFGASLTNAADEQAGRLREPNPATDYQSAWRDVTLVEPTIPRQTAPRPAVPGPAAFSETVAPPAAAAETVAPSDLTP